jgi:hypothetical protein
MTSSIYDLFAEAMRARQQITCFYEGYYRELCPHILGRSKAGEEAALAFQFAGTGSKGLPEGGQWRCLRLAGVSDARLRAGPWHGGASHTRRQACVATVDLDVNPQSPYNPKHRC